MNTNQFTTSDNKKFWEGNQAVYQAAENAAPLIFITREFIGKKILDAGGGDGSLMHALKNRLPGVEVLGVDLAPKHPDVAQGDLTDLRFEDARFDTIFCLEVIEHVSPEVTSKILAELHRVLKSGGLAGICDTDLGSRITGPASPAIERIWDIYLRFWQSNGGHPFIGRELKAMIASAGFIDIQATGYVWVQSGPEWVGPWVDSTSAIVERPDFLQGNRKWMVR